MVIEYELSLEGPDGELVTVQVSHNAKNDKAREMASETWDRVKEALTSKPRLKLRWVPPGGRSS